MSPPSHPFHASELPEKVQYHPDGKRRKPPVDLQKCKLMEMVQYNCDVVGDRRRKDARVACVPVVRYFRRCAEGLTVETTVWEEIR